MTPIMDIRSSHYGELRMSSVGVLPRLTFLFIPPLTDNHGHHLGLLPSCVHPPSNLPGGRSLVPSFRTDHQDLFIIWEASLWIWRDANVSVRRWGWAEQLRRMFETCLNRLIVSLFNTYKNNPNHSVLTSLILVLLAQRCGFPEILLLLPHTHTHKHKSKSASDHNGPFSIQPGLLSKHPHAFSPFPSVSLAAFSFFYSAVWQTTATRRFSVNEPRPSFHISGGILLRLHYFCVWERKKQREIIICIFIFCIIKVLKCLGSIRIHLL